MASTLPLPAAPAAGNMTFAEFERQYGDDSGYEFWFGKAVERSSPTWVHGLLQKILMRLLDDAGFISASEIEMRVIEDAHPKPDVVATANKVMGRYPTTGLFVGIEIISENDSLSHMKDKSRYYQEWGFQHIYLVDPPDESVTEYRDGALTPVSELVGIPVARIWEELNKQWSPGGN